MRDSVPMCCHFTVESLSRISVGFTSVYCFLCANFRRPKYRDSVRIKLGSYNLLLVLLNLFSEINYAGVKSSRKRKLYDQPFNGLIYLFIYHEHGCCFKRSAISLMSVARDACHIKCRTYAVDCLNRSYVRRNEVRHRNLMAFKVQTLFKNTQPLRRSESNISTRFCSNLSIKSRRVV